MPTKLQQEKKAQAVKVIRKSIKHLKKQVPNEEVRDKMVLCGNASTSKVKDSGYGEHKANVELAKLLDAFGAQFTEAKESIERARIRDKLSALVKRKKMRLCYYDEERKKWINYPEHPINEANTKLLQLLKAWKPKEAVADSSSNNKKSSGSNSTKQKSTPSNSGGNATAVLPSVATRTEGLPNNVSAIENSKMHATVDSPLRKKQKTSPTIDETKELQNRNKELEEENKALKKRCKALEDGNSMPTEKREASDAGRPDNIISEP